MLDDDDLIRDNWQKIRKVVAEEIRVDIEECTLETIPAYSFDYWEVSENQFVEAMEREFNFKVPDNFRLVYSQLSGILIYTVTKIFGIICIIAPANAKR